MAKGRRGPWINQTARVSCISLVRTSSPYESTLGLCFDISFILIAPKPKSSAAAESKPKSSSQPVKNTVVAGKASGKRTLAEIMDQDLAAKKKMREQSLKPKKANVLAKSRFFAGASNSKPNIQEDLVAGPSRILDFVEDEKENVPVSDEDLDFATDPAEDPVTQEDGYIS